MSYVLWAAAVATGIAVLAVPLRLAANLPVKAQTLSAMTNGLLLVAGILSAFMMLLILAAAAWGMNTSLPWGLGIYMYLVPALSVPAFFLLFISVKVLARTFWLFTIACAVAWYFGDRSDRISQGLQPLTAPREIFGMFFNAFTILFVLISVLVQLAAFCKSREKRIAMASGSE